MKTTTYAKKVPHMAGVFVLGALLALSGCNTAHTQHGQGFDWQAFGAALTQMGGNIYNNTEAYRRAKVQAKANALGLAASGDRNTQIFGGGYGYNPFSSYYRRPQPQPQPRPFVAYPSGPVNGAGNAGMWRFGR